MYTLKKLCDVKLTPKIKRRLQGLVHQLNKEIAPEFWRCDIKECIDSLFIVQKNNRPIAFLSYRKFGGTTQMSTFMFVDKKHRHRGIGEMLQNKLIEESKINGFEKIIKIVPILYLDYWKNKGWVESTYRSGTPNYIVIKYSLAGLVA